MVSNLSAKNGKVKWSINNNKPSQGSPAIYENNVYQMTIYNEIFVYDIDTGKEVWRYTASFVSAISNAIFSILFPKLESSERIRAE